MKTIFTSYKFAPLYSFAILIPCLLAAILFLPRESYFYAVLMQRGLCSFLILWLTFNTIILTLLAKAKKDRRGTLIVGLVASAMIPVVIGIIGFLLGISSSFQCFTDYLTSGIQADLLTGIDRAAIGIGVSTDPLLLGILSLLLTFLFILPLCLNTGEA